MANKMLSIMESGQFSNAVLLKGALSKYITCLPDKTNYNHASAMTIRLVGEIREPERSALGYGKFLPRKLEFA